MVEAPSFDTADGGEDNSPGSGSPTPPTSTRSEEINQVNAEGKLEMEIEQERPQLGSVFYQCRAARIANLQRATINLCPGADFGTKIEKNFEQIGSLDKVGGVGVLKTFHGGRLCKSGKPINQSISTTFDPATLRCITCEKEHSIFQENLNPIVLVLSDQNFIPFLPILGGDCLAIVRVENSSLPELVDFAFEIFDSFRPPTGSVLMLGSPSHLHSVGTSAYATDWVDALARLETRWEGVHVCPLVPIIRENFPTSLARELLELAYWLASVYSGTTRGLGDAWLHVVSWLSRVIDPNTDNAVSSYSIQLPSSLAKGCRHITHTFQSCGSSPTSLLGICSRATDELVYVLASNLNRDFHTDINPQSLLRDLKEAPNIKDTTKSVVLLGGSNLSNTAPYISALGYKVWDLSQRGLVLSGGCIDSLIANITASDIRCDTRPLREQCLQVAPGGRHHGAPSQK